MGKHILNFDPQKKRLLITLMGDWTMTELKVYQQELIAYVEKIEVKTVLIDQLIVGHFPPESMIIFKQNTEIPQLKAAVVAMAILPKVLNILPESAKVGEGVPRPFGSVEEAVIYLDGIK